MSIYKTSEVSLLDMTKLIGTLSSTIQAVLHACIQFLQQRQVVSLKQNAHQGKERVGMVGKQSETLQWPIGYTTQVQIRIQTDTSNKRWGVVS